MKKTLNILIEPKMLMITPMFIWSATSQTIYSGIFISLMARTMQNIGDTNPELAKDVTMQNEEALFTMIIRGLGDIVGGNLIGNVRDRISNKAAILTEMFLLATALTLLIAFN